MSPLQRLLETAASELDPAAISRAQQRQGDGMQALLGLAGEALHRAGGLESLLCLLLSQDVQGCSAAPQEGQSAKARGNASFKQRRFEEAAQHYTEALSLVDETTASGAILAAALYCNRALCFLRLSPPQATWAVEDASCAIACDPTSSKAWYRRACARQAAGDLVGALEDAEHALEVQLQQQQQQGPSSEVESLMGALQRQLGLQEKGPPSGQQTTEAEGHVSSPQAGAELSLAVGRAGSTHGEGSLAPKLTQSSSLPSPSPATTTAASPCAVPGGVQGASVQGASVQGASSGSSGSGAAHNSGGEVASEGPPTAPATAKAGALARQRSGGALTVGWSAVGGRFLAASQDLPGGADVLREAPFALALTRAGRRTCCHHCGRELATRHQATSTGPQQHPSQGSVAVPAVWYCRACPVAQFCSPACREAGEASHCHQPGGGECGRPWSALLSPEALLALRLARRLHEEGPASEEHHLVASLEAHFAQLAPAEAARLALLALVVHATWQGAQAQAAAAAGQMGRSSAAGAAQGLQSGPEQASLTGLPLSPQDVLRALCQVRVNGIAVVPPARAVAADRLGLALYPAASMMNHACCPNVSLHFQGVTAVLRTLGPLPAGAPLLHCYGPQQGEMSWRQRQHLLRTQYCFDCSCAACAAGPSAADVEMVGLRCPRCDSSACGAAACSSSFVGGAVLPPVGVPVGLLSCQELPPPIAGDRSGSGCSTCGAAMGPAEWEDSLLPHLLRAAEHAARAEELVEVAEGGDGRGGEAEEAVQLLGLCLEERRRLLHPNNHLLGLSHDALARALHAGGRPAAAATHLRASLDLLTRHYTTASTAVAFQQLQLAAMLRLAAGEEEAGVRSGGPSLGSQPLGGGSSRANEAIAEADELECAALEVLALHFGPEATASLAGW